MIRVGGKRELDMKLNLLSSRMEKKAGCIAYKDKL